MKFIGIDLGTTNSAITSFDGKETRIWKSPEQADVTPSVIYGITFTIDMYAQF